MLKGFYITTGLLSFAMCLQAQPKTSPPPALQSIRIEDLRKDMEDMTGDRFRGRGAGTLDELNAAVWQADKFREIGLLPAGDNGTYFQFFSLWRNRPASSSYLKVGQQELKLWKDYAIAQMAPGLISVPLLYAGPANKMSVQELDVKGKAVVMEASPDGIDTKVSLPYWRYWRSMMLKYGDALATKGAAAIIFIADEMGERSWVEAVENLKQGLFALQGMPNAKVTTTVPVFWVHAGSRQLLQAPGASITAQVIIERFEYPSANVIGKLDGTDPSLRKEYVLFSSHHDAHGIRNAVGQDSIYNGADDNGSVGVSMLAIARAFKKNPARRSALFISHGAEERGLLGSRWYAAHPTISLDNVVAVLNGDMIGRNHPDSAAVLGTQPPHRNSLDLTRMAIEANQEGPRFKLDTLWDNPAHKEFWYFRSDHVPYARLGIPALMYTTLLHPDYHTVIDDAAHINYEKLKKMTEWIYRTGWKAANADKRPDRDPSFKPER